MPFYYGWAILAVGAMSTYCATGNAQLLIGGVQNFIFEDTQWSRNTVALGVSIGTWSSGKTTPFIGRLADRYGPRGMMPLAAFIVGLSFFYIANSNAAWQFCMAIIIGRTISQPVLVGVVPRTAAVNFFQRRRNLALGIATMARPFGASIHIQIFALISLSRSWRNAYQVQALLSLIMILPMLLIMRRRPSDLGLPMADNEVLPDKAQFSPKSHTKKSEVKTRHALNENLNWSTGEAILTPAFWLIIIAESLSVLTSGTINFQVVPLLKSSGVPLATATLALSISSFLGSFGNPIYGFISDKLSPKPLTIGVLTLSCTTLLMFLIMPIDQFGFITVIVYGTVSGGLNIMGSMMMAHYFGKGSFGSITGLMGVFQISALGLGPTFGTLLYTVTKSYSSIFLFGAISYVMALICVSSIKNPNIEKRTINE